MPAPTGLGTSVIAPPAGPGLYAAQAAHAQNQAQAASSAIMRNLTGAPSRELHAQAQGAPSATSKENTLIVFDWDDTLFPTSALERNRCLRMP